MEMREIALVTATAAWCRGCYAGIPLTKSGFDAALGFDFILNVLCFLYEIWDGVERW